MSARPPLVTLTTDFGETDPYVGALRGVLHSDCPGVQIADISHGVPPFDLLAASYLLGVAAPFFPPGTVHLAVVDPGVGGARRALAFASGGQFFVGPDNGLFTAVFDRCGIAEARTIDAARWGRPDPHPCFHGRDLFAPAAAALARGVPLAEIGPRAPEPVRLPISPPVREGDRWLLSVLHVDRFGNVATNLTRGRLAEEGGADAALGLSGSPAPLPVRRTFEGAPAGTLFLVWGSSGFLELAADRDSAAARLRLVPGAPLELRIVPTPRGSLPEGGPGA